MLGLRNAVYGLGQPGPTQEAFQKDLTRRVQKNAIPAITNSMLEGVRGVDYGGCAKKLNDRTPELVQASMEQMKLLSDDLTTTRQQSVRPDVQGRAYQPNKKIRDDVS